MSEHQWYVVIDGAQFGPMTWEGVWTVAQSGRLQRHHLVWRDDMANWQPASTVPTLFDGAPPPFVAPSALPSAAPPPVYDRAKQRIASNAKQNCMVLFVTFAISVVLMLFAIAVTLATGADPEGATAGIAGFLILCGGGFSAFYLPIRWGAIMGLPAKDKTLGLIGGFGFLAMLVLAVFGLLIGA